LSVPVIIKKEDSTFKISVSGFDRDRVEAIVVNCGSTVTAELPFFIGNRKGTQISTQYVLPSRGGVTITGPVEGDATCTITGGGAETARREQEKGRGFEITVARGSFTAAGPIVFWVFFGLFILFIIIVVILIIVLAIKISKK